MYILTSNIGDGSKEDLFILSRTVMWLNPLMGNLAYWRSWSYEDHPFMHHPVQWSCYHIIVLTIVTEHTGNIDKWCTLSGFTIHSLETLIRWKDSWDCHNDFSEDAFNNILHRDCRINPMFNIADKWRYSRHISYLMGKNCQGSPGKQTCEKYVLHIIFKSV